MIVNYLYSWYPLKYTTSKNICKIVKIKIMKIKLTWGY